jgi:hypothetical protein
MCAGRTDHDDQVSSSVGSEENSEDRKGPTASTLHHAENARCLDWDRLEPKRL